ncbi:hypothetical protein [Paenibacillus cymbidii]|uniref:hypothetical protein n=1 Tax=Paenibacillus cymbidii TaxID=1639034 RepID=UPI002E272725
MFLKQVPGCYFWLGSGPQEHADQAYGLHSPRFVVDEACIPLGARLLAAIGLSRLGGPLLKSARCTKLYTKNHI